MNSKRKGNVALGQAIAWYLKQGSIVSVPLTEAQAYDLIVDDGVKLKRVEVKFTSIVKDGNYVLDVRSSRLSARGSINVKFNKEGCEELFVVTASFDLFRIPTADVGGTTGISLGPKYERWRVSFKDVESKPGVVPGPGC